MTTASVKPPFPPSPPAPDPPRRSRWGLWAQANFRKLWIGETTSGLGTAVGNVALALVAVVTLEASPFMVGLLTASAWVPWLFLGLLAGAWVDRWPRLKVMLVCDLLLLLLFGSVPVVELAGPADHGPTGGGGTAGRRGQGVPVDRERRRPARSGRQAGPAGGQRQTALRRRGGGDHAAPAWAGLLSQAFGAVSGLLADAVTYLVAAICVGTIRAEEKPPHGLRTARDPARDRRGGPVPGA